MSFAGTLARKGATATFTKTIAGSYDASTDIRTAPTTITVVCDAMEIDGDFDLYSLLGLIESESRTLLARPRTAGVLPSLGMTVVWGGETLTVRNTPRLAMNGVPTAAKIVVSR